MEETDAALHRLAEEAVILRERLRRCEEDARVRVAELRRAHDALLLHERAMEAAPDGIAILDVRAPENPLVYVNAGFERQTGYARAEVLHRSARFIHGPETDPDAVERLRAAIRERREYQTEILSYRKDGSTFWNRIAMTPLRDADGTVTHYVAVQSDVTKHIQTHEEVHLALDLLEQTNMKLTRVNQRMKRNLDAAAKVQQALLPDRLPRVPRVRFAWRFRPCDELAGDILNVFRLDAEHIGLYVLDVTGHGTAAALLAVSVSRLLVPAVLTAPFAREDDADGADAEVISPAQVADRLNQHFPWEPDTNQFFTLIYGVLNTRTLEFRYVSAGHPGPVILPAAGVPRVPRSGGLPIGLASEAYAEETIALAPGDHLYLYSDGVTDVMDPGRRIFGQERLVATLRGGGGDVEARLEALLDAVARWRGGPRYQDDLTLLGLEILPR